ncbi:hypothetical protein [Cardinium endosymbiont of Philonthus spinipes]|uniref:hypothetical protein n=1 Tax=Cardinium endosymbiont of Philonthus spinipes TaxID=3077941 RepID=UPI00313C68BD
MEKQKSPAARASKESVFPNHLQGVASISKLFTGALYYYGHSVEQIHYIGLWISLTTYPQSYIICYNFIFL